MAEFKYEITQELGVISEGKYNIEPVSYTHLDVYKRQVLKQSR